MRTRAKVFAHAASLAEDGTILADGEAPIDLPAAWTAEHLVLAAVARCTLKSLRYHARERSINASVAARSTITRREEDGRYAIVALELDLDVTIEPEPEPDELADLLARAERDCFVGNSLTVRPTYRWQVNDRVVEAVASRG
jgi:organic hydroperoxide reductase OsmC/OhrA